jgi:hypothetical protein
MAFRTVGTETTPVWKKLGEIDSYYDCHDPLDDAGDELEDPDPYSANVEVTKSVHPDTKGTWFVNIGEGFMFTLEDFRDLVEVVEAEVGE